MSIGVLATQDTKADESAYLAACLVEAGVGAEQIDTTPSRWIDTSGQRSRAEMMSAAAAEIRAFVEPRVLSGELTGVCVIAGATGGRLTADLLSQLPFGVPKLLVSPIASSEARHYIGASDTIVVPPVVDFAGRNEYSDFALSRAAEILAALVGGGATYPRSREDHIAVSAFGVTNPLIAALGEPLRRHGERLTVFSANGTGGEAFEKFIEGGMVHGALDLTLSELADELCGGVLSAGPERGWAASRAKLRQIVMPGGIDFINFGPMSQVPPNMRDRKIVEHTSAVTLVRTSPEENYELGRMVGSRALGGGENCRVLVPTDGYSVLSSAGGPLHDPSADAAFEQGLQSIYGSAYERVEDNINGPLSVAAVLEEYGKWKVE